MAVQMQRRRGGGEKKHYDNSKAIPGSLQWWAGPRALRCPARQGLEEPNEPPPPPSASLGPGAAAV